MDKLQFLVLIADMTAPVCPSVSVMATSRVTHLPFFQMIRLVSGPVVAFHPGKMQPVALTAYSRALSMLSLKLLVWISCSDVMTGLSDVDCLCIIIVIINNIIFTLSSIWGVTKIRSITKYHKISWNDLPPRQQSSHDYYYYYSGWLKL